MRTKSQKTISDRLVARKMAASESQQQEPPRKNFATLVLLKGEISAALADGWFLKDIWELLRDENRFLGSYSSFIRLWNRLSIASATAPSPTPTQKSNMPEQTHEPIIAKSPERTFSYDNMKT